MALPANGEIRYSVKEMLEQMQQQLDRIEERLVRLEGQQEVRVRLILEHDEMMRRVTKLERETATSDALRAHTRWLIAISLTAAVAFVSALGLILKSIPAV